ncbi:hypothetical protein Plec18167_005182 [Paecilomyces lecythidis]|uniref:MoaB/Mog domain-containing protein n=1 Tax=Paecilomyces lecythidis TaxID=3004212 RepID=A0ABR3XLB0_9EURO
MEPGGKIIQVVKPARKDMNRRFAGNDFQQGDSILNVGDRIKINHLMALASIGVANIAVRRKPRIGLFSTGKELLDNSTQDGAQRIMDINGPCITATLMDWGCDVDFLGVIDDNASAVSGKLMRRLQHQKYDLVITTGGVSAGKFDFVRKAIESIGAKVLFHGAGIRPGHPALFATLPAGRYGNTHVGDNCSNNEQTSTAFFGLPGNPVASAACLRFFVVPFLRQFLSEQSETPMKAIIRDERIHAKSEETYDMRETHATIARFPPSTDIFRAGRFIG